MTQQFIQPQRQAIGSFRSPNGVEVPVTITVPWFRALNELFRQVNSNTDGGSTTGPTIDESPTYVLGSLYYASGPNALHRLLPGQLGQYLAGRGNNVPPAWADLPTSTGGLTPRQVASYSSLRV